MSRDDVDDLTQEVCARFLAAHPPAMVHAERYLFGIARHVLADFLRQRKARREVALSAVEDSWDADARLQGGPDPAAAVFASDLLVALLERLPRSQQAVLLAREAEGYSCREVADRMGFSEATVQTYLKRARSHLRDLRRRM